MATVRFAARRSQPHGRAVLNINFLPMLRHPQKSDSSMHRNDVVEFECVTESVSKGEDRSDPSRLGEAVGLFQTPISTLLLSPRRIGEKL